MASIFLVQCVVLIVFTVSGFEFHQVRLPWLRRQWWVVPSSSDLKAQYIGWLTVITAARRNVWGNAEVLTQAATEAKNSSRA